MVFCRCSLRPDCRQQFFSPFPRHCNQVTTKPQIYVVNLSQKNFIRKGSKWLPKIAEWVKNHGGGQIIPVSCEFEEALSGLKEDPDAQKAFLADCSEQAKAAGLKGPQAEVKSMMPRLIRAGRNALCLQSFYTAGPKEVRAWTIMNGTLAPQAAGVIHTDFERGFIKAEVCNFDDFKELHGGLASMAKVKDAGKYRQEGKLYVMQEGDIGEKLKAQRQTKSKQFQSNTFLHFAHPSCVHAQCHCLEKEISKLSNTLLITCSISSSFARE